MDIPTARGTIKELGNLLLEIEGEGDFQRAKKFADEYCKHEEEYIKNAIKAVNDANVPVDIHFIYPSIESIKVEG